MQPTDNIDDLKKEIERLKAELQNANERMRSFDKTKNEFINMAAHELRAPLTAIKGFLSMVLSGDAGEITPKAKEFLQDSAVSAERMIRLVNNMLNVSRIEEGRLTYEPEVCLMRDIVHDVQSEFTVEARRKNLELEVIMNDDLSDSVCIDADKIHEVIVNFVSNAIKYTTEGRVRIILSNPDDRTIRVSIEDTGIGISPEEQKKLFQKFYRVESKVGKTIGTGLGLYISKLIVESFNGNIGMASEPNRGSTFWFELPLYKTEL